MITVPTLILPSIIKTAQDNNIDAITLFKDNGIDLETLAMEKDRIPVEHFSNVIIAMTEATQNPTLGLCIAHHFSYEYINEIETFLFSADKLLDGFQAFRWINQLLGSIISTQYQSDGITFTAKVDFLKGTPEAVERSLVESSFRMMYQFGMQRAGSRFKIKHLTFKHRDRNSLPIYQNVFNCPISLGAEYYGITFEQKLLEDPLSQSSPAINALARNQVEQRFAAIAGEKTLQQQVFELVVQHPYLMQVGIEEIAKRLYMTPRTFQRNLKAQGCTYSSITNDAKQQLAKQLLGGKLPLDKISDVLGFSDRRSFTRAFQRWFAIPPSTFRKLKHRH